MNEDVINEILWRIDPMNTSCNQNDGMENEYRREACEIAEKLFRGGEEPLNAVMMVFDKWFWENCLLDAHRKRNFALLMDEINKVVGK